MLSDSDPGCEPNVYIQNRYETMKYVHVYTTFTKKRDHFCALYKKKKVSFLLNLLIFEEFGVWNKQYCGDIFLRCA